MCIRDRDKILRMIRNETVTTGGTCGIIAVSYTPLVMLCLVGGQGAGKSTFVRLLAGRDEWFSDDLKKLDDENAKLM